MNTLAPSIFDLINLILAGKEDMHESLDEFKFRPDTTTNTRVVCPYTSEKFMYNVVNTLAPLFLIGSFSFLAHLGRRLKGELIVYQSSRRLCVWLCVCGHFQTRISLQPVGQS